MSLGDDEFLFIQNNYANHVMAKQNKSKLKLNIKLIWST